ncbi:hypothetical protein TRVA0_059S00738 [Trichomonascus vanleenenianus]|uniref:J-domain-containing protein n=1 Tax=Trichomonascus vanleenenianus TaxID=2268995 RepID=UPI003ECADCE9
MKAIRPFHRAHQALGPRYIRSYSEDSGYMKRRLEQLAEESRPMKEDPNAGQMDPIVKEIYDRIQREKRAELGDISKFKSVPEHSGREIKEIAMGKAWKGTETAEETANRLALDKLRGNSTVGVQYPTPKKTMSASHRISAAREKSLDYTIQKHSQPDKNKEDNSNAGPSFKELYAERFMGPSGASGVIASVNSIASKQIEDAIARGQFKNIPRGENVKIDQHLSSSPYIDTTELFLNRMIQRQGAAPPWIELQRRVNKEVDEFRRELKSNWIQRAVSILAKQSENISSIDRRVSMAKSRLAQSVPFKDQAWEESQKSYHNLVVNNINSIIRGYNLQAPQSARKGYISYESELAGVYQEAHKQILSAFKNHLTGPAAPPPPPTVGQLHTAKGLYSEDPSKYYGMKDMFRDLFSRKKST